MPAERPFWEKPLDELTAEQWELLCDGCARCCLLKLEDEESGEVFYTSVACRHLDLATCRCSCYAERTRLAPECVKVTPKNLAELCAWMPRSCAYRRLAEGRGLAPWHPLRSGDPESVVRAGISIRGFALPESELSDPEALEELIGPDFN